MEAVSNKATGIPNAFSKNFNTICLFDDIQGVYESVDLNIFLRKVEFPRYTQKSCCKCCELIENYS